MKVTADTTPHYIIKAIGHNYYKNISYITAFRARAAILNQGIKEHRKVFTLLPLYIASLRISDPEGYFHLVTNAGNKFHRCFFCPAVMRNFWLESQHFLALDRTFLTGRFILTLLLAVGIDANSESTIIAWGIVEGENTAL